MSANSPARGDVPPLTGPGGGDDSPRSVLHQVRQIEQKQQQQQRQQSSPLPPVWSRRKQQYFEVEEQEEDLEEESPEIHPDVSCVSSVTLSHLPPPAATEAALSDVSLSATDVKFLVKALKRAAGDDFTELIESIKQKQQPEINWRHSLSRYQQEQEQKEQQQQFTRNVVVRVETVRDDRDGHDNKNEEPEHCESVSHTHSRESVHDGEKDDIPDDEEEDKGAEEENSGQSNSILDEEGDSYGSSDSDSAGADKSERVEIARKISFSPEDHVRVYDLTPDEIQHKTMRSGKIDENDVWLQEARQWRQSRKYPGVFCATGRQVDEAAALLSKLYAGSVETAKVCGETEMTRKANGSTCP